jgi:hypothetical protein
MNAKNPLEHFALRFAFPGLHSLSLAPPRPILPLHRGPRAHLSLRNRREADPGAARENLMRVSFSGLIALFLALKVVIVYQPI